MAYKKRRRHGPLDKKSYEERPNKTWYRPTPEVVKLRQKRYSYIDTMIERRNLTYREFADDRGDQTLRQMIDDSDRRLNGYTLTREAQGKDDHQANIFNPVTRAKVRAVVAGVAMQFPELQYSATKNGLQSPQRAELARQVVNYSRQGENQRIKMFWEAWETAGKGTVITYDGYRYVKENVPVITEFDPITGEVKTEDEEVVTEDRCVDEVVPLTELFIWDFYIHDIQEQPRVAWIDYMDEDACEKEYGSFANYKYLRGGKSLGASRFESETDSYYYQRWSRRSEENDYKFERIRYYSKAEHCYEVWINGVLMQKTPLLWGGKKNKRYPFAKSIYEPFSNKAMFYGMSLAKLLQAFQDADNITWDMILDSGLRSLNPRMIAGLANKDLLDIEDELNTQDDITYVPDVTQVRPIPVRGIQGGDVQLLNMIRSAMDFVSVDPTQQGVTGVSGKTAREVVIANERAQELKGIFHMMMEDLWIQKTRLRVPNVIMNYLNRDRAQKILGETGASVLMGAIAQFDVNNALLSDGSRGTLGIAVYPNKKALPAVHEVQAKEDAMEEQGYIYKQLAVTSDYLDDWEFDFQIVSASLENTSFSAKVAKVTEKQAGMVQLYPEYVAANKEKLFAEYLQPYGETPEEYQPPAKQPPSQLEQLMSNSTSLTNGNEGGGAPEPPPSQIDINQLRTS